MESGADAVYLGGPLFNARRPAENFSLPLLKEAVAYAHLHNVKVYVTLNTLIYERESDIAMEYLMEIDRSGADAVLIQDTGLLRKAHELVPGLPLHASTQAGIHNSAGVRWAANNGFSRVVIARELSIQEICDLIKKTEKYGIGIEIFAHGALCYSYSGQCLLSSVIGGRSGNRGLCAQPCRKPYSLVYGEKDRYGRCKNSRTIPLQDEYLLSMKDLSLYPVLDKVVNTGVVAIKIEGRMRSPDYVRTVTTIYRKALDSIARGSFVPCPNDEEKLLLAFNRGFTTGYFGKDPSLFSRESPGNKGVFIGTVTRWDNRSGFIEIKTERKIHLSKGDGIAFQGPSGHSTRRGFSLNEDPECLDAKIFIRSPFPIKPGTKVYLTHNAVKSGPNPSYRERKIPVSLTITINEEGELLFSGVLQTQAGINLPVQYVAEKKLEKARNAPVSCDTLKKQMQKADTLFRIEDLTLNYNGEFFAPLGVLNTIRRDFFEYCKSKAANYRFFGYEERLKNFSCNIQVSGPTKPKKDSYGCEISLTTDTHEGVISAIEARADSIYYDPAPVVGDNLTIRDSILNATEHCSEHNIPLVWVWPRIIHDSEMSELCSALMEKEHCNIQAVMAESTGLAEIIRSVWPNISLIGGPGLNITNHYAIEEFSKIFDHLILSCECSKEDIFRMVQELHMDNKPGIEMYVEGNTLALVSEDKLLESLNCGKGYPSASCGSNCFLGLKDIRDRTFPVSKDYFSRTIIRNSVETCLIDNLKEIVGFGITRIGIDARGRTPDYISQSIALYREALSHINSPDCSDVLARLRDRIREVSLGGITRGPYSQQLP